MITPTRPQPLAPVAAAAATVVALLSITGVTVTMEQANALVVVAAAAAPYVAALATALLGRRFVTPVADPRDADGHPLVRADRATDTR